MHGCGTCIWKQAAAGVQAVEGKFFDDKFVGDVMPCSTGDAVDSAVDADMAAFQARSFHVRCASFWGHCYSCTWPTHVKQAAQYSR